MIQKLTENLRRTQQHGQKIQKQLKGISDAILKTKIESALLKQKTQFAVNQIEQLTLSIKKKEEQYANYQYKKQKMEIRIKEYNRKVVLQQEIYDKKISYQSSLNNKIQNLQKKLLEGQKQYQSIQSMQNQIDETNLKISKQGIELENLYHQLMKVNKLTRTKQDQLYIKKKMNLKKKAEVQRLKSAIASQHNKQNDNLNLASARQTTKIDKLQVDKQKIDEKIGKQIDELLTMLSIVEEIPNLHMGMKKQLAAFQQIANSVKLQKVGLTKLKYTNDSVYLR